MMNKKVAALALVGALGVTGLAPLSVNAASDTSTQETEVTYFAGGAAVGANAYVEVPASLDFQRKDQTVPATVKLMTVNADGGVSQDTSGLENDFKAGVEVQSTTGYTLENSKYNQTEGEYELKYGSATYNKTNKPTDKNPVGTLTKSTKEIAGTAKLTKAPDIAGNTGLEKFADVLTYTITIGVEKNIPAE